MKRLYICFLFVLIGNHAFASTLYRHIPFKLYIHKQDTVSVHYDFTGKKGISCIANAKGVNVDFLYKGHQKNGMLPIILQSDHIPQKKFEELADVSGQFDLTTESRSTPEIHCDFAK